MTFRGLFERIAFSVHMCCEPGRFKCTPGLDWAVVLENSCFPAPWAVTDVTGGWGLKLGVGACRGGHTKGVPSSLNVPVHGHGTVVIVCEAEWLTPAAVLFIVRGQLWVWG